ncbi:MAG: metal ABC transporter substrate-binding protein [Promethearchaeota archaeon]
MESSNTLAEMTEISKPKIVCYFSITKDWTENLVGDTCEVVSLVSGQQDVHSYDPSADALLKMDGADLYVMLGISIEAYASDIAAAFPEVPSMILRVDLQEDSVNGVEPITDPVWTFPDGRHPKNEHFWTSPQYAIKFCRRLAEGIKKYIGPLQDASFNATIDRNLNAYISKLSTFLNELRGYRNKEPIKSMKVCPFHPAFIYFFEELGIERVAVIEQQPGGTVSASHLEEVDEKVDSSVIVVYHPQESEGKILAEDVARENGANVTWLTPLIPVDTPQEIIDVFGSQIDTYLEMVTFNVYQLLHSAPPPPEIISGYFMTLVFFSLMFASLIIIFQYAKKKRMTII